MTKALRVTIVGVGSTLALIIFMILFAAATTFLEIKESGEVGLLFLALLFSCWAATHVALKRWLCPPTTQPTQPTQPPPLPRWFRHLYFPLATTILYIPVAALWLYWERAPWSMTAILIAVAYNISGATVGGVLIKRWLRNRAEVKGANP